MNTNIKKSITLFISLLFIFAVTFFITSIDTFAATQNIYDNANILSEEEINDLNELCTKYGEKRDTNIAVVTVSDKEGKLYTSYMEDFYDEVYPGENCALLVIDMEDRGYNIHTFYLAEKFLNNSRMDKIISKMNPLMADDDYVGAIELYIKSVNTYMGKPIFTDNMFFNPFVQLIFAVIVAGIIVFFMVSTSDGKGTLQPKVYLTENSSVVNGHDKYIRTAITKVPVPKNNNSNGGNNSGSGGTTSGGHSYSSGSGGSF